MNRSKGSRRVIAITAAAFVMLAIAGTPAHAQVTVFTAALSGSQEVPPNASSATGTITVTLDQTLNTLSVSEVFSGLVGGPAIAAHIHCCAAPGTNASVAVPFTGFPAATSGVYTHLFDLTDPTSFNAVFITNNGGTVASARAALIAGMFAGLSYANIHDQQFPGGEIRGQLVVATPEPASAVLFGSGLALLAGAARRRRRTA
jgi:hypothetical protein